MNWAFFLMYPGDDLVDVFAGESQFGGYSCIRRAVVLRHIMSRRSLLLMCRCTLNRL